MKLNTRKLGNRVQNGTYLLKLTNNQHHITKIKNGCLIDENGKNRAALPLNFIKGWKKL